MAPRYSFGLALLLCGCTAEMGDAESTGLAGGAEPNAVGATDGSEGVPAAGTSTGAPTPLPAEVETRLEFELPHAGQRYVYAVNTVGDNVAVIDSSTLAIHTVETGDAPTYLQTLAGADAAVVLNVASSDATILRTKDGKSSAKTVSVQAGANAIAVAPDGEHAVAFFDSTHSGAGVNGSFQDVSILYLKSGSEAAVAMTVGFRPSAVQFSSDGKRAFVTTEDGVSILDFADIEANGAHFAKTVPLGDDATTSLDVSVTPGGEYALARREGESLLRLVDLASSELFLLDLSEIIAEHTAVEVVPPFAFDAGAGATDAAVVVEPIDAGTAAQVSSDLEVADAGVLTIVDASVSVDPAEEALDAALVDAALQDAAGDASADSVATDEGAAAQGTDEALASSGAATPSPTAFPTATSVVATTPPTSGTSPLPAMTVMAPVVPPAPAITDLDLAKNGEFAVAVVRGLGLVLQLDIPGAFTGDAEPRVLEVDKSAGSVSITPDSKRALLYTTADLSAEKVEVLDLDTGMSEAFRMAKAVKSVAIADDSKTAFIVHQKLPGDPDQVGIDPDAVLDRSFGYSVFEFATGFSKLQTSRSEVGASTVVPDGSNLFVLFSGGANEVHQVNLKSFIVEHVALGSSPTSVGAVPGSKRVFVGQNHPDGRIAFIDWETGDLTSVTGFELNSRIRE